MSSEKVMSELIRNSALGASSSGDRLVLASLSLNPSAMHVVSAMMRMYA
jgi:hypothetical protein